MHDRLLADAFAHGATFTRLNHLLMLRWLIPPALLLQFLLASAQPTVVQQGKPFERSLKGASGDIVTVVDGLFNADGRHLLYIEEGLTPKLVRLDAMLQPTEEVILKDQLIDGLKWTGVMPLVSDGKMQVLLVSATKKGSEFGIAEAGTNGGLAINGFRRLAAFDIPYVNDPANTMAARPLPDPILFSLGLAYVQKERLIESPDGKHHLLNHSTHHAKGMKRLALAWLDKDLTRSWESTIELPYEDAKSRIHQTLVSNDGTVRLLTYVFPCTGDGQMADKNCHELHLTTIAENGKAVSDVLIEKDFISSARMLDRADGKVAVALRYGSLTGQPGLVMTFDPGDPKLKPTPVASQRLPSIRKAKLPAYGDPTADPRKPLARTAKVPDEIVALLPAPDGGMRVAETFLEYQFPLQMSDAIAMRHLSGSLRVSQVLPNDSIGWQKEIDRALMTTAGQAYDGSVVLEMKDGLLLLHNHTPRGYDAILKTGAAANEKSPPEEPQVLKAVFLGDDGTVKREGTALMMVDAFIPCPMGTVIEWGGTRALVKSYDRGNQYRFTVIDLAKLGAEP